MDSQSFASLRSKPLLIKEWCPLSVFWAKTKCLYFLFCLHKLMSCLGLQKKWGREEWSWPEDQYTSLEQSQSSSEMQAGGSGDTSGRGGRKARTSCGIGKATAVEFLGKIWASFTIRAACDVMPSPANLSQWCGEDPAWTKSSNTKAHFGGMQDQPCTRLLHFHLAANTICLGGSSQSQHCNTWHDWTGNCWQPWPRFSASQWTLHPPTCDQTWLCGHPHSNSSTSKRSQCKV